MPHVYKTHAEAAAACPEGWRVDAVVTEYDPVNKCVLAYGYFPAPPADDFGSVAFQVKNGRAMEPGERFLAQVCS